jgi:hypothetical protein
MAPAYNDSIAALEVSGDGTVSALYPDSRAVISMPPAGQAPAGVPAVAAQP